MEKGYRDRDDTTFVTPCSRATQFLARIARYFRIEEVDEPRSSVSQRKTRFVDENFDNEKFVSLRFLSMFLVSTCAVRFTSRSRSVLPGNIGRLRGEARRGFDGKV